MINDQSCLPAGRDQLPKRSQIPDTKRDENIVLALDVGERHTGVAFARTENGIPLPLETISHMGQEELLHAVTAIVAVRNVSIVVLGHPLLPSGSAGKQAQFVEVIAERLRSSLQGMEIVLLDERHTNPRDGVGDPHAVAALRILQVYLDRCVRD